MYVHTVHVCIYTVCMVCTAALTDVVCHLLTAPPTHRCSQENRSTFRSSSLSLFPPVCKTTSGRSLLVQVRTRAEQVRRRSGVGTNDGYSECDRDKQRHLSN